MSDNQNATTRELVVKLDEAGNIVELPDQIKALIGQKVSQARKEVKASLAPDPTEVDRMKTLEEEVAKYRLADEERTKNYEQAKERMRAEQDKERQTAAAERERLLGRIRRGVNADLETAALKAGARENAASQVAALLAGRIGLDADLNPIVLDDKGQPAEGQTVEALVTTFLEANDYFRAVPAAKGGGARGGATVSGASAGVQSEVDAALDAYKKSPTPQNMQAYRAAAAKARQTA